MAKTPRERGLPEGDGGATQLLWRPRTAVLGLKALQHLRNRRHLGQCTGPDIRESSRFLVNARARFFIRRSAGRPAEPPGVPERARPTTPRASPRSGLNRLISAQSGAVVRRVTHDHAIPFCTTKARSASGFSDNSLPMSDAPPRRGFRGTLK
jgi:hypothetical protein